MSTERRLGVAVDFSVGSKKSLSWTIDNMARKGDHLILINVRPQKNYEAGEMQLWETTGSPLIRLVDLLDPSLMKKYDIKPDQDTLEMIKMAADQKHIDVLMKIYWGDPREKLIEAIDNIPLNCLIMGSRGLGSLQRVLMGSVSNHVMNNATCPVTVVKQVLNEIMERGVNVEELHLKSRQSTL
ncbi:hypothetical protein V2J09_005634 [Rumex salicifolius]